VGARRDLWLSYGGGAWVVWAAFRGTMVLFPGVPDHLSALPIACVASRLAIAARQRRVDQVNAVGVTPGESHGDDALRCHSSRLGRHMELHLLHETSLGENPST
jgi:hypothetical protein